MSPGDEVPNPGGPGDDVDPFDPFDPFDPATRRRRFDSGADARPRGGGLSPDQPPPSPPASFDPPVHPALQPAGEHVAHSAIGSLVGGVLVWGGLGLLLDRWLDTGRVLTATGVVLGFLTGFYIVYVRFGRDERP